MNNLKYFKDFQMIIESSKDKGSACAIVENDKGEVLILQRGSGYKHPETGEFIKNPWMPLKWNFPGGKIDNDETPEQGLQREILEETSLKADPKYIKKYKVINDKIDGYTLHVYHVVKTSGQVSLDKNQIPPECVDYTWVNPKTFSNYEYVPHTKEILKEFFILPNETIEIG